MDDFKDSLYKKIKVLTETVWDNRASKNEIELWLSNFKSNTKEKQDKERLHALYLLSQFMYFASTEMRVLLRSLYRDLIRYPIVETIRKSNNDSTNTDLITSEYTIELKGTRFLAVGNPSESGSHLLYYFRQENSLGIKLFINSHEIFKCDVNNNTVLEDKNIKRYVFIDDFCGSGEQASKYSKKVVQLIKDIDVTIEVWYFVLFANEVGLDVVRNETQFDKCDAVFRLDETYKCFGDKSRYKPDNNKIDMDFARTMTESYGKKMYPGDPLGYDDNQLLLGFFHNTPDNTLPVIWHDDQEICKWNPIFRRYPKIYGDLL